MDYRANIVPTLGEMASGSVEPTSRTFKAYVGMVRLAPFYMVSFAMMGMLAGSLGLTSPMTLLQVLFQTLGYGAFMAAIGFMQIARTREPSIRQIRRLAELVRLDPSLARKINAMAEPDYTFRRLQRFILENSAQANGVEMEMALDDLDDAINGRPGVS